jgi:hypothetical protein
MSVGFLTNVIARGRPSPLLWGIAQAATQQRRQLGDIEKESSPPRWI